MKASRLQVGSSRPDGLAPGRLSMQLQACWPGPGLVKGASLYPTVISGSVKCTASPVVGLLGLVKYATLVAEGLLEEASTVNKPGGLKWCIVKFPSRPANQPGSLLCSRLVASQPRSEPACLHFVFFFIISRLVKRHTILNFIIPNSGLVKYTILFLLLYNFRVG